jgi:hypothetical protein
MFMKIPLLKATSAITLLLILPQAWAVLPNPNGPLPNHDKRKEAPKPAVSVPNTARQNARALLESRVPGLQISTDNVLGTPRWISAQRGFLTGPQGEGGGLSKDFLQAVPAGDPHRVVKAFLNEHAALFGHDASALDSANVTRDYVTKHNGLHTMVWEQTLDGIPVFESLLVGHVTKNGQLVSLADHFVSDPAQAATTAAPNRKTLQSTPPISAAAAIARAAADIDSQVDENSVSVASQPQGAERRQILKTEGLTGPAYAQLVWFPLTQDSMRLCWRVIINGKPRLDRYMLLVDAETGEVPLRYSLTENLLPASYNVYTNDSPSPFSPGWSVLSSNQPPLVKSTSVTIDALDATASPNGWIDDTNNTTTGNNVDAFVDRNFDLSPDVPRPVGITTNRIFNFPFYLNQDPITYGAASTVQLFWRANWYHDRLYQLGFTEAAGNYQTTNFNRGGLGNDAVVCLVQCGADVGLTDNSQFEAAPDGTPGYCLMFIFDFPVPARDGSLDSEVVCHEMTHGVSNRLLGQGVLISAFQTRGMGEGWSDFYAMCLLSESTDDFNGNYAFGGYVTYQFAGLQDNYYFGIRRYPYTTDMTKNPLTFKDIDPNQADPHIEVPTSPILGGSPADEVHNQGEVWCVTLHEVWVSLVTKFGWAIGNELTLQLVTDGLKLAPANANFLEARDGIIQADAIYTGGSDYVELWTAFAKRGMGFSATSPDSSTTIGVSESFDFPPDVVIGPPDGTLEVGINPPNGTLFFAGDTNAIYVRVRDSVPVTNATVVSRATGVSLSFHDDGTPPDVFTNDGVYSAKFVVPGNVTSLTIPIIVAASGKANSTNEVTYSIIPVPPNDNFANATKVPGTGAKYLTSNSRATIEVGEPKHAGDSAAAASLWWNFAPATAGTALVDTGGSDVATVVGVYTGNNVSNLQTVASASGSSVAGGRKGAFAFFQAQAGAVYHIAVASLTHGSLGSLRVNIGSGLQPDTNAPAVSITSPATGLTVNANHITVTGSAVDPDPNASGIRKINISVTPNSVIGETSTYTAFPMSSLDGPQSTNWVIVVGLQAGVNTITARAVDFAGNISAPASVQITYRPLDPPNDLFVNALVLTNASGVIADNTLNATKEIGEPNHAGLAGGKSAWWDVTPSVDGLLHLSTTNSSFDTVLAIYTGNKVSALTPVASNDDAYPGAPGGFSELFQPVLAHQTYHIAVDGYGGAGGAMFLTYSLTASNLFLVSATTSGGGSVSPSSIFVQSNGTVSLSAVAAPNYVFDAWSGSLLSLANPLTTVVRTNLNLTAHFILNSPSDGFESGNFKALNWKSAGAPWLVQTNVVAFGSYAAQSGSISNGQTSSLILTANFGSGDGSFSYRVSSEPTWATLSFYVDGLLLQTWSGDVAWNNFAFPLAAGTHTLEWRYAKSLASSTGLDAAFIDNVFLPLLQPIDSTTAATLSLLRQSDGIMVVNVLGQTNQLYTIQSSSDFAAWQDLVSKNAVDGFLRAADPSSLTNKLRYYRAVVRGN